MQSQLANLYKRKLIEKSITGRLRISSVLDAADLGKSQIGNRVTVCGWARTVRKQMNDTLVFIVLNDGSTSRNLQVVVSQNAKGFSDALKSSVGCSFKITGYIVESPAKGQAVELLVEKEGDSVNVIGFSNSSVYPLAKKEHSREFLRDIAHLRPRTQLFGAVMRIRNSLAFATHEFFQNNGFLYIHTPLITDADCEGAGELFQVTNLLPPMNSSIKSLPICKGKKGATQDSVEKNTQNTNLINSIKNMDINDESIIDYNQDFFGKPVFLTVSGQLALENFACSLSDVYTFGPTFRAENSHTSRHLAEFWMIEPEISFADIYDDMYCAEAYLRYCIKYICENNESDIQYLDKNVSTGLIKRLENIHSTDFVRISYTEAIELLKNHNDKFTVPLSWGMDLGSEHEKYLTDVIYEKPCIVYNYPKDIKSFYMKQNDDNKTVAAMDVLIPGIGEVIGGSQREDNIDKLEAIMKERGMELDTYLWYFDLRKYGSVPHAGFGLGFERLVMLGTGMENIRDVIPFPRYPKHCDF